MTVYEDLVVKNAEDIVKSRLGNIKESEVRQTTVRFMADTKRIRNVITRDVFERLGLRKRGEQMIHLVGGEPALMDVSGQMEIIWHDRRVEMDAAIAPAGTSNLLSITTMELLDIMPNPSDSNNGCLVGVHGDEYINELE